MDLSEEAEEVQGGICVVDLDSETATDSERERGSGAGRDSEGLSKLGCCLNNDVYVPENKNL
jgi:hypothetical protein